MLYLFHSDSIRVFNFITDLIWVIDFTSVLFFFRTWIGNLSLISVVRRNLLNFESIFCKKQVKCQDSWQPTVDGISGEWFTAVLRIVKIAERILTIFFRTIKLYDPYRHENFMMWLNRIRHTIIVSCKNWWSVQYNRGQRDLNEIARNI